MKKLYQNCLPLCPHRQKDVLLAILYVVNILLFLIFRMKSTPAAVIDTIREINEQYKTNGKGILADPYVPKILSFSKKHCGIHFS